MPDLSPHVSGLLWLWYGRLFHLQASPWSAKAHSGYFVTEMKPKRYAILKESAYMCAWMAICCRFSGPYPPSIVRFSAKVTEGCGAM